MMRSTFICLTLLLAGCGAPHAAPPTENVTSEMNSSDPVQVISTEGKDEQLALARGELATEPKVKDYVLDPSNAVMLQVAVEDDGTRRYGLAGYFCQKLRDWKLYNDDAAVRIVDAAKVAQSGGNFRSISLGTVSCKDESRWD